MFDVLDDLARKHGVYATGQVSVRVTDTARIGEVMRALRADPPREVAGAKVTSFEDLEEGPDGLPPTDGLRFGLASGARIVVRPSGTEPRSSATCRASSRSSATTWRGPPGRRCRTRRHRHGGVRMATVGG